MKLRNLLALICASLIVSPLSGCNSDNPDNPESETQTVIRRVIYEANPGLFGENQALSALSEQLPRIKRLGADVVWLMPIYPQGQKNAVGSPYCVKDYKAVSPSYGTLDNLKALVEKAHSEDMLVIMDWVANHTSWDNAWIDQHKDWYTQDDNGNIISPEGQNWSDVADLNYDNADMRKAMQDAMLYWINEADIDGFRCDYAEGVPTDFWSETIPLLREAKQGTLLMLAEGSQASLFDAGFDLVYAWNTPYRLQDIFTGDADVDELYTSYTSEYTGIPTGKLRMGYITNHDMSSENSPIQTLGGEEGALSAFVATLGLGGCPMIYSSQEIGYAEPLSFFGFKDIDWTSNADYQADYEKLMQIYHDSEALQMGDVRFYQTKAISIYRTSANERVLIFINPSNQEQSLNLPIERVGDSTTDLWTGESQTLPHSITMQPYEFKLFKIAQ